MSSLYSPRGVSDPADLEAIQARISARFGMVPSFFMMARVEPPIVAAMFSMAEFAYFDAPLPTLFKERLFTYVSRFCAVPYCMARHCAFLLGCGNVAGHPEVDGISIEEAMEMLQTPFPNAERRAELLTHLRAQPGELDQWPDPKSALGDTVFFASAVAFLMPQGHKPLLAELERVLGQRHYHYLTLFLGFVRFAHFWTESHQELRLEEDIEHLLAEQRTLAEWVAQHPNEVDREIARTKAELEELERLRALSARNEQDVVELREIVAAKTRTAERAEAESRAKAAFMATLSHELRTPLNAVIGYSELLERGLGGALEESAKGYVTRIKATARHQQHLIDEILSFSRLEAGRETLHLENTSLHEIREEVCAIIAPLAEARGLAFTADFADAPRTLRTDPGKLRQVLLNLLGNAVKFTTVGSVALTVAQVGDAVVLTVSDTGPGINDDDRERIFEPFTQLDSRKAREFGGTGLGLAITQRLVALLDGSIAVAAAQSGGSIFVVTLPTTV